MPSFSSFGIIKTIICFPQLKLIFEVYSGHMSISLVYKTLRIIAGLFFCKCFPAIYFWLVFYSIPVTFIMNGLIFETPCGSFLISSEFNATVATYWKHLSSLFFGFIVGIFFYLVRLLYIWSSMFKIHLEDTCNTTVELNQKQNRSPSLMLLNQFGILKEAI